MARVVYGVQGVNRGHAMRALHVARAFPEHEFLFVSSHEAERLLRAEGLRVYSCANLTTFFDNYQTNQFATIAHGVKLFMTGRETQLDDLCRAIEAFAPDVGLYDYEHFTPVACRRLGLPRLSLDHQHVMTCCEHRLPRGDRLGTFLQSLSIRLFFTDADHYLVTSFFHPPVKRGAPATLVPPLLREAVLARQATAGEHVLVYQSCSSCPELVPFLRRHDREFRVYGHNREGREGNVTFHAFSEEGLLDDLASAAYVICGGGHQLISEALHHGKPVIALPVRDEWEQAMNAFYLEQLGYGVRWSMRRIAELNLPAFEDALPARREAIARGTFCGNALVRRHLTNYIRNRRM